VLLYIRFSAQKRDTKLPFKMQPVSIQHKIKAILIRIALYKQQVMPDCCRWLFSQKY